MPENRGCAFLRFHTMAFRAAAELRKMGALSHDGGGDDDDDVHGEFTKFKAECRNDARTSGGEKSACEQIVTAKIHP